jgi:hypothetical protein
MARGGSSPLRRIRRAPQMRGFLRAASCRGTASVGAWQQIRRALGGRATDVGTTGSAALRTSRSQGPLAPPIDLRTESLLVGQGVRPVERAGVHPGGARPRTRLSARVSSCAPRPWPKNAASRPKYAIAVPPSPSALSSWSPALACADRGNPSLDPLRRRSRGRCERPDRARAEPLHAPRARCQATPANVAKRAAAPARAALPEIPSFAYVFERCRSTVRTLRCSRPAI